MRAVEDLSGAEAHERRVPSLTTPIALLKHCAVARGERLAAVIAEYRAACRRSEELAAGRELDDTVEHHIVDTVSPPFIYLGMITEIARHAGHADILAEQIRTDR